MLYGLILVFGFNLCVIRMTVMDYRPFNIDLDSDTGGDNHLSEGYPKDVGFNRMMSADAIFLQMHLKDKENLGDLYRKKRWLLLTFIPSFIKWMMGQKLSCYEILKVILATGE